MHMPRKFIGPLTAAASGLVLVTCAAPREAATEAPFPQMVVDNYRAPSAAALYAQRFQSSVAQLSVDNTHRFVLCGEECPGATPKTPRATLNAAVLQRMRSSQRTDPDSHKDREPAAEGPEVEAADVVEMRAAGTRIDSADVASTD